MATGFGLAQLSTSDYAFTRVTTIDKALLYDAVNEYVMQAEMHMRGLAGLFVEGQTTRYTDRYQLPMGGMMSAWSGEDKPAAKKRKGKWDVAFPLYRWAETLAMTTEDYAYMTGAEFRAHIDGMLTMYSNRRRHQILRRIFKNTNDTVEDEHNGVSLTVKPLANGDTDVYPPVNGSDAEATADHYVETGYAATAMSDTNNPYRDVISDLLTTRFGRQTGGIPIATLINKAERAETEALSSFVPYVPSAVNAGVNTDSINMPNKPIPGEIIGYIDSTWVAVNDWIPANYAVGVYLNTPAPLKERISPPDTNLGSGLQLENASADWPFLYNNWVARFGVGTGNRLAAVVVEFGTGGTYSIPSAYQT